MIHPAEHRSGHAAQGEDAGKEALIAAALAWRHEIGDGGLRQHHQAAGAKSLQSAEQDQPGHRVCEPAQCRAAGKDNDC